MSPWVAKGKVARILILPTPPHITQPADMCTCYIIVWSCCFISWMFFLRTHLNPEKESISISSISGSSKKTEETVQCF